MSKVSVGRAELDTRPHFLYRFYDRTGVLLYIGITVNFEEREKQHAASKEWWARVDRAATRVEYHLGRRAVLDAERLAIKTERPLENDHHNEWVEIEGEEEEDDTDITMEDFVSYLLVLVTDEEIEEINSDNQEDMDGNKREPADLRIHNAFDVLLMFDRERSATIEALSDLIYYTRLVDDTSWREFTAEVRDGMAARGEPVTSYRKKLTFLRAAAATRARHYLDRLGPTEAEGWRNCARGAGADLLIDVETWAAGYACSYKDDGWIRGGMCSGPHQSGARCPNRASQTIFFEICPACERGACLGHPRWCDDHTKAASEGHLGILADDPYAAFPILTSRPFEEAEEDPWAVPF